MKTRNYFREETDTFDEINKVVNELRGEIVADFEVVDKALTALSSRIAKLDMRINNLENPEVLATIPKKKAPKKSPKKKKPSAKTKKK